MSMTTWHCGGRGYFVFKSEKKLLDSHLPHFSNFFRGFFSRLRNFSDHINQMSNDASLFGVKYYILWKPNAKGTAAVHAACSAVEVEDDNDGRETDVTEREMWHRWCQKAVKWSGRQRQWKLNRGRKIKAEQTAAGDYIVTLSRQEVADRSMWGYYWCLVVCLCRH